MTQSLTPITFAKAREALASSDAGLATPFAEGTTRLVLPSQGVTVVAAKTGEGKTSLMLNLLLHGLQENADQRFYFVSYEEPDYHLLIKLLMILSRVQLDLHDNFAAFVKHFRAHDFDAKKEENKAFRKSLEFMNAWLEEGRLHLYSTEMPCDLMVAELMQKAQGQSVGGIFVDYIQRVRVPKSVEHKERYLQLKAVSEYLVALTKKAKAAVVVGAQRRQQYQAESSLIDSIRESSDISHDASLVLVLTREKKGATSPNKYLLHVCKNRFGRSDYSIDLVFDGPSYSFLGGRASQQKEPSFEVIPPPNTSDEESKEWKDSPSRGRRGRKSA